MTETLLSQIRERVDAASEAFSVNEGEKPIALLWPDKARQWSDVVPLVRETHRVVTLGERDESAHSGPAYWVRCAIAGTVDLDGLPATMPIVYMPGIGRDDLKDPTSLSADVIALGGLQHRSLWFSHPNSRDWTIRSLLQNEDRGLGLLVAGDDGTADLLRAAIAELCGQPMHSLAGRSIDTAFLQGLLSPDTVRSLLDWLNDPQDTRDRMGGERWTAFAGQCKTELNFDPDADGEIAGARRFGLAETKPWERVWERYVDNPRAWPGVQQRLIQGQPQELIVERPEAWPGVNSAREDQLRNALRDLETATKAGAVNEIKALEVEHGGRREWLWAELGQAPLANALEHLVALTEATSGPGRGGSVDEIKASYRDAGWRADDALMRSLAAVSEKADIEAVCSAATLIYREWAHAGALALQAAVGPMANADTYAAGTPAPTGPGIVTVFIDGLRLDIAHRLQQHLEAFDLDTNLDVDLAALPTVTETAKPALVPVAEGKLAAGEHLDAARAESGASAGVTVLRSLMEADGVDVLGPTETGDPGSTAWTETGEVDHKGHDLGLRFVYEIDAEVARIADRIRSLLDAGWTTVQIVTDHGWLLVPGGLDKTELPAAVYEPKARKGRCARLKAGAAVDVDTVPWHWDNHVRIAVAPGITCFTANQVYEHGGVSPQECFVPRMTVTSAGTAGGQTAPAAIAAVRWSGLGCRIEVLDAPSNAGIDIRIAAGDPTTSVAMAVKQTTGAGSVRLLVSDEDLEGTAAAVVIVGSNGELLAQRQVTIGSNT
jgi:hypothetical protein